MPTLPTDAEIRLNNVITCLTVSVNTLEILANGLQDPVLQAISNTTKSLLEHMRTGKQNKNSCIELVEQTYELLSAIVIVHIKSDTGGQLPPRTLYEIGRFANTLHKVHTLVDAQQSGSWAKKFFRHRELSTLLRDCKAGLKEGLDFFRINAGNLMIDISRMRQEAERRHQDVLNMIEDLSDVAGTDTSSNISNVYSGSHGSTNSISMLPSQPKIFYGRESELSDILSLFSKEIPRIAILGAAGMGKTSLATTIAHHQAIAARYQQHRYFVACDSVTNKADLAALIGAHLGLKPGIDLTQPIIRYLSGSPSSLLILDNLETVWEPSESRGEIEEFLSQLTDVESLALIITMRGAERPSKVRWTRPFLWPLEPLRQHAARQTFVDIADDTHNPEEVDKVLLLTGNMPLAVSLLAHLADSEGCSNILSRWKDESTSMVSEGYDKRSNLDISISLSLSSPRLKSVPHSHMLLSLLSMLPDGLSDVELVQSSLPINDILACKAALIRTTLAYQDGSQRLKALVPIREFVCGHQPAGDYLLQPLRQHFQRLLELYIDHYGTPSNSPTVARISLNFANLQSVLRNGLQQHHPDLTNSVYCALHLNVFSRVTGRGTIPLLGELHNILAHSSDHRLRVYFITELFASYQYYFLANPEAVVAEALKCFEQFDDPDLECRFNIVVAEYYRNYQHDFPAAMNFCLKAKDLAISTQNTKRLSDALYFIAWRTWQLGDYSAVQTYAYKARRLARISADLHREARALYIEAMSWLQLGNYKQAVCNCKRARNLLGLSGMSGSNLDCHLMNTQAEVHKIKSEYVEAGRIYACILQETSADQEPYVFALALVNLAENSVSVDCPADEVQRNIEKARKIFQHKRLSREETMCEVTLAALYLREQKTHDAKTIFERCFTLSQGNNSETMFYCLEHLGDVTCWTAIPLMCWWTMILLVHSLKSKSKCCIHKALQFLGDVFLSEGDVDTAHSLFTLALEGFTQMDIHRSRAKCMLRLGDISKRRGHLLRAVEFWETARPLFERSSQVKEVDYIDQGLATVGEHVREQHRKRLDYLKNLTAPASLEDETESVYKREDLEAKLGDMNLVLI